MLALGANAAWAQNAAGGGQDEGAPRANTITTPLSGTTGTIGTQTFVR